MRIKSIKSIKRTKSTKRKTNDFLPFRWFYAHKDAVFFVSHTKKHEKHKKHKNDKDANKRTSDFPHLKCFYAHKNAVFFVFVCLYAFCAFCACEIFL